MEIQKSIGLPGAVAGAVKETVEGAASGAREARALGALHRGSDEEAAKAFESFFATMFVREMRKSLPSGFFAGAGADVYASWLDDHLGETLAARDALGLAGLLKAAVARAREAYAPPGGGEHGAEADAPPGGGA